MSGGGTESAIQAHSFRDRSSQLFGQTWVGVVWKFLVSSGGLSDMSVLASSTVHLTQPSGSSTDIFLSLCSKQRPCYSCPACLSPVSWFWLNGSLITVLLKWKAKCLTWTPPFPLSPPPYLPVYFRTAPPPKGPFLSVPLTSAALHGCSTLLPSWNPLTRHLFTMLPV